MLKYSANNQTFYRCKSFKLNWLGRRFLIQTFEEDPREDYEVKSSIQDIRKLLDDDESTNPIGNTVEPVEEAS